MTQEKDLTRRDIMKAVGAASVIAAAQKLEGAPAIQTVKAANSQVQYGMIGTGSRGSYLLKHLKSIDNGRCVAVCDVNQDHLDKGAETIGTNPSKYKDYRELLSHQNMDAVFVVVPLFLHFGVTKDCLLAGKHTFCEFQTETDSAGWITTQVQPVLSAPQADGRQRHTRPGHACSRAVAPQSRLGDEAG